MKWIGIAIVAALVLLGLIIASAAIANGLGQMIQSP